MKCEVVSEGVFPKIFTLQFQQYIYFEKTNFYATDTCNIYRNHLMAPPIHIHSEGGPVICALFRNTNFC